jgi:DEAD/DEAH box helicase domain-containing protein
VQPLLDRLLAGTVPGDSPCTHIEALPARPGAVTSWPDWTPPALRERFAGVGVTAPWRHQVAAAELAHAGRSVVVATGTASGKSLAYQLPGLTALVENARARVLYLAPTKALAGDQLRAVSELAVPGVRAATYDGDTPAEERDWVRAHANWVLTNPDMLHRSVLPAHERWAPFFRRLRYVVVDECHAYRGLFGAHVALVLRRLVRVARLHGADPVFVLASATSAEPAAAASRLLGRPLRAITQDGSARPAADFVLWEPTAEPEDDASGSRRPMSTRSRRPDRRTPGATSCWPPAPRRASRWAISCPPWPRFPATPGRRCCTWRRPRRWPRISTRSCVRWTCRAFARRPTTATPRPTSGTGRGPTATGC